MAIDKQGNLYVATYYGVQIFNNKGEFVGMINLPFISRKSLLWRQRYENALYRKL
jgi:sugar lactone lactonase YvrE